jgi:hypothetical protein
MLAQPLSTDKKYLTAPGVVFSEAKKSNINKNQEEHETPETVKKKLTITRKTKHNAKNAGSRHNSKPIGISGQLVR